MPLQSYSHIMTLGSMCSPTFQLCHAAGLAQLPKARIAGPFDWFGIDVARCTQAFASNFADFFRPDEVRYCGVDRERFWKMEDAHGVKSRHHLPWRAGDTQPSRASWDEFHAWLGKRLRVLGQALAAPGGHLLMVRLSDPGLPDRASDLLQLASTVRAKAACRVTLAAVSFGPPPLLEDESVRTFRVEPSWPAELSPATLDWRLDYGRGPAWQGDIASWSRIWAAL
jgi:hypothetical protein